MIHKDDYAEVQEKVRAALADHFPQVSVLIGDDIHYQGTNLVITTPAFAGLFPEQRFHHVVRALPEELYESQLKGGVVWFELAPGESAQDYMKMSRSEDMTGREREIIDRIRRVRFFERFTERLGGDIEAASLFDLTVSRELFVEEGLSPTEVTEACLLLIRYGGFCDRLVLEEVLPQISAEHAA